MKPQRHWRYPSWHRVEGPPPWHQPEGPPRWPRIARRRRGFLFLRFVIPFGLMAALVLGGMGVFAFLLSRYFGGGGRMAGLVWLGGCGLSLALPLLATALALRSFRRIATPLADIMAAADALAEGNLSARVPPHRHGEFARLARSFNRMAEELERADQQRRNLTADVAHELRTPLHIIQGNLEGILDQVYEPTAEHIEATLDEARLLARLVDDLQILSLAETGQLTLVRELVDVAELLADAQTSFSGQAEAAGIDLRIEVAADRSPLSVDGDAGRLSQVLGNLVANGLRYTPAGGTITLRAERAGEDVHIIVADTGQGIPTEDLPYVFERFWRGDRSRSRTGGTGSGLGLTIARQLVQAHGGRIHVESTVGHGTTFTVELPAAASDNRTL